MLRDCDSFEGAQMHVLFIILSVYEVLFIISLWIFCVVQLLLSFHVLKNNLKIMKNVTAIQQSITNDRTIRFFC